MSDFDTLSYGENVSIAVAKLPQVSSHRLMSYGLAHLLGNQAASKVVAWADKDENKNATDEAKAAKKAEFQSIMVTALLDGTIGQHATRGPAADPRESIMESLARKEVLATLKANNIKAPKKDEAVEFPNGDKLTMDAMIERRVAKHGDRLGKEADAVLKERARAAKKLAETTKANGLDDL